MYIDTSQLSFVFSSSVFCLYPLYSSPSTMTSRCVFLSPYTTTQTSTPLTFPFTPPSVKTLHSPPFVPVRYSWTSYHRDCFCMGPETFFPSQLSSTREPTTIVPIFFLSSLDLYKHPSFSHRSFCLSVSYQVSSSTTSLFASTQVFSLSLSRLSLCQPSL